METVKEMGKKPLGREKERGIRTKIQHLILLTRYNLTLKQ